jgi:hypothetical protein
MAAVSRHLHAKQFKACRPAKTLHVVLVKKLQTGIVLLAEITCVSGCTCPPSLMDGHWEQKNSQVRH